MDFKNFLFSFLILQLTSCILHGFYSPHQQHNRGMATLVFQPVTTGPMLPNWNISAVIGWIAMNVGTDIHGPQRINPNDLWNPSLLLLPHTEIHPFRCSCFKNKSSVVCLYSQAACASHHHVHHCWWSASRVNICGFWVICVTSNWMERIHTKV